MTPVEQVISEETQAVQDNVNRNIVNRLQEEIRQHQVEIDKANAEIAARTPVQAAPAPEEQIPG